MAKVNTFKPYKTITGWKLGTETLKDGNGRIINQLFLGERKTNNETFYISEEIYKDILDDILYNPNTYHITFKPGLKPQLVITLNGALVIHNASIYNYAENIKELLKTISPDIIIDAYYEIRLNMESKKKLGDSTKALVALLNAPGNTSYSVPLIQSIICSQFENKLVQINDCEICDYLRAAEYEELIRFISEIHRHKTTGNIKDNFLKNYINEEITVEKIQEILGMILILRLYGGTLTCK